MKLLHSFLGKLVDVGLSGKKLPLRGSLIDVGNDIIVLHNGSQFTYIPTLHLQYMTLAEDPTAVDPAPQPELPFDHSEIAYRKILMNAKGIFSEISISGSQSLHGYVTSIMNDFFVFFSPVYRTVYISLEHVKSITPYISNTTPYSLGQDRFPLHPTGTTLSRTFEQQLKKLVGELVVFNLGEAPNKIGRLNVAENNMLELVTANGQQLFMHMSHVKSVHLP
ncbi:DUF2642 domain-containing protein [Paenibacillus sp. UNC499MF]|uniref:DUF2642 domain-containing protein n=1 Tax=unclassified Paenibacillus TaxID=185978 RepID=UPI00089F9538|nr:DUF2642 domain-containing protein [Paenibacillus sp. UNC499MF]SEG68906.1 hypothetical protein SAMN02799616_04307 [Paenibacillus sp. UNC499MF]